MQKRRQYKDLKTWQPHPCSGVCILGNKFQNYNSWQYLLQKAIPTNLNKFCLISSQQGIEGCQGSQNMLYSSVDLRLLRWLLNWFFFWWASTCSTSKFGCTSCKENMLSKLGQILDRSQPLFYFVPQNSHSQAGSTNKFLILTGTNTLNAIKVG